MSYHWVENDDDSDISDDIEDSDNTDFNYDY
jgi:hypothetical protein